MEWVHIGSICDMMVIFFFSSVLETLLEARLFRGLCESPCCRLHGDKGMLGCFRTSGRFRR